MLGEKHLYDIVMSAAFAHVIPKVIPGYDVPAKEFWLHNIAVAVFGEKIAALLGIEDVDMVYTAGLLHDIGKLAIGSFVADSKQALAESIRTDDMTLIDAEKKLLGTDHTEVGEQVGSKWKLPVPIQYSARYHHNPDELPDASYQPLLDIIHAADGLAFQLGFGNDFGELARRIQPTTIERLGLKVQKLESVASDSLEQINEMGSLF